MLSSFREGFKKTYHKKLIALVVIMTSLSSFASENIREILAKGIVNKTLLLDCQIAIGETSALETFEIGYHPQTKELFFVEISKSIEIHSTKTTITLNKNELIVEYSMPNSDSKVFKMSLFFQDNVPNATIGDTKYFCD